MDLIIALVESLSFILLAALAVGALLFVLKTHGPKKGEQGGHDSESARQPVLWGLTRGKGGAYVAGLGSRSCALSPTSARARLAPPAL